MTSVRYVGAGFRACTKPFVTDVCVGQALPARLWGECLHGEAACGMTIRSAANALWFARPSNRLVERFDAATALASRRGILERAAHENWLVSGGHVEGFRRVVKNGAGYELQPA